MSDYGPKQNTNRSPLRFKDLAAGILYLLKSYSSKIARAQVEYVLFLAFVKKHIDKEPSESNLKELISSDIESDVASQIEYLHQTRKCIIEYRESRIQTITYLGYYIDAVREAYARIDSDIEVPFPTEESLKLTIPIQFITVINVKTDFMLAVSQFQSEEGGEQKLLRLLLPENIQPIIITSDLLPRKLLEYSVYKMKLYIDDPKNATYMEHKLISVIKQKDLALREMIAAVSAKTASVIQAFIDPNEFSFAFWAHFVNLLIQEYRKKVNKLPRENDFCQAAHFIGLYNVYFKGAQQREKEKQIALRIIEKSLHEAPFVYNMADIYRFKDKNGFPIIRKISKNEINEYLKKLLHPEKSDELPELMQLKTHDRSELYIHRQSIIPYTVRLVFEASLELKKWYLSRWIYFLKHYRKSKPMKDDLAFFKDAETQVESRYPMLSSLLNYELLFMARKSASDSAEHKAEIDRLFTRKRDGLIPLTGVLGLNRKALYQEARSHLPLLETIPIIGHLIVFIKRLFWGIRSGEEEERPAYVQDKKTSTKLLDERRSEISPSVAADEEVDDEEERETGASFPSKESHEVYTRAISRLENQLVGNEEIDEKLAELAEKWNPLYDPAKKAHLVDDVSSIIRDYLKNLRQSFRVKPPDAQRIRVLAETLARNRSFDKIKKKQFFVRYIEISMIKILRERIFAKKRFR